MITIGDDQENLFEYYTMDCWKDRVFHAGKSFPAGTFATEALNSVTCVEDEVMQHVCRLIDLLSGMMTNDREKQEENFRNASEIIKEAYTWTSRVPPFCYFEEPWLAQALEATMEKSIFDWEIENRPEHMPLTFLYAGIELLAIQISVYNFAILIRVFEANYLRRLKSRRESDFAMAAENCFNEDPRFYELVNKMPFQEFEIWQNVPELNMSFAYVEDPDAGGAARIVKRVSFQRMIDFLFFDLMNGMEHGHAPARCQNCKRYFLTTNARAPKYCDGQAPQNPAMTCRQYGAMHHQKEQNQHHPVYQLFNTKTNTIRKHYQREKITAEERAAALALAAEYRDQALMDNGYARSGYLADMELEHIYEAIKQKG